MTYNHERDAIDGLVYRFGDTVGCERHREMRVDLSCGEAYDIVAMDEAEQCSYRARIEHPSACERDRLALYPLLLTGQGLAVIVIIVAVITAYRIPAPFGHLIDDGARGMQKKQLL